MNPYLPPPQWSQYHPRPVSYPRPVRIEVIPDAAYGLAILPGPSTTSGVALGALATGIGSLVVSAAVWCFGLFGAKDGWGGLVAGAFGALSAMLGIAGLALGWVALRQIRRNGGIPAHTLKGRGIAITGMICGGAGLLLATVGVVAAIALSQGAIDSVTVD